MDINCWIVAFGVSYASGTSAVVVMGIFCNPLLNPLLPICPVHTN